MRITKKELTERKCLFLAQAFIATRQNVSFFLNALALRKKDSSKFDSTCPFYAKIDGHPKLSEEPTNAIQDCLKTYKVFANFMNQFISSEKGYEGYDEYAVWDRMAFTDYVQFFLPTVKTYPTYFSKRDFNAFIEVLQELKPDVVIAWGLPITTEIRDNIENNSIFTDLDKLPDTEHYICHLKVAGIDHEITYVSCYHPSSVAYWYNSLDSLSLYLKEVLNN